MVDLWGALKCARFTAGRFGCPGGTGRMFWWRGVVCMILVGAVVTMCDHGDNNHQTDPEQARAMEDLDGVRVSLEVLWRSSLQGRVERIGALAVWDDGVIWIGGGRGGGIWELEPTNGEIRRVDTRLPSDYQPGRTLQMARQPNGGLLVLSRNGVTRFRHRQDEGVFVPGHREKAGGIASMPSGDYVISHVRNAHLAGPRYALHRYRQDGTHLGGWHPVFDHYDWRIVEEFSGGPVTVTTEGDLIVSEASRFRITRYARGMPDSAHVVSVDDGIVPEAAIQEAIRPDGWLTSWTRSLFVDQWEDGCIMNVVREVNREGRRGAIHNLWVVVEPGGEIVARSRFAENYWYISRGDRQGRYVVVDGSGVAEIEVSVERVERGPAREDLSDGGTAKCGSGGFPGGQEKSVGAADAERARERDDSWVGPPWPDHPS